MKSYVKPALEVISVKTSENIAADTFIKTLYTKVAGSASYTDATTATVNYASNDDIITEVYGS